MPALAKEPATAAPLFLGLQSYTEAQAPVFFGRDEEIQRLTNLIKANTLTIVFGKSGTGKTSLLNAGVFPRLRKDYCLPFRIRLEFSDDSPGLVQQIRNVLKEEIDKYGFKVESYPDGETLWEYFHREQLWKSVTPILIFDQFEEIFTLAKKSARFGKEELDAFWQELADLIENSIPEKIKDRFLEGKEALDFAYKVRKIKTLFSFREEFLPEFEGITAKIPSLKYSRFRLLPMNGRQAYEVITKTWKGAINAAEATEIVQFFSSEEGKDQPYELMTIEPSLLSQVCSLIEKERLQEGKEKISSEFLDKYSKSFILRSIYDEAMAESNSAVTKTAAGTAPTAKPVNEFAEDKLITDEGYRTKYALSEKDEGLRPGIAVLRSKYFVRDEGKFLELTHDVLTPLIKRDREKRRKELALTAAKKKTRRRVMLITAVAALAALGFWYFTAGKAIQQKQEALQIRDEVKEETKVLAIKIDSGKASLKTIDSNIKQKMEILKVIATGKPGAVDSAWRLQYKQQIQRDSLQILALNQHLTAQKTEWERKDSVNRTRTSGLTATQKQFDSLNRAAQAAQTEIASLNGRLLQLQKSYDELLRSRQTPSKDKTDAPVSVPETGNKAPSFDAAADTNSLRLNLYYNDPKKAVEKDLKVYLIPSTAANKGIISSASSYERRCDEANLDKAQGRKLARYVNGTYVFLDVQPGSYLVKICTYFGGYEKVTKKERGNMTYKMNVAPAVP